MIEWYPNTKPYRDCFKSDPEFTRMIDEAQDQFSTGIRLDRKSQNLKWPQIYDHLYKSESRNQVIARFEKVLGMTKISFLKKYFNQISNSPENFYVLRANFCNSFAAVNICSYILGIGDRHLDNFLVDQSSGHVIPIDFGHAFGSSIELTIPELVPFRLTNQIKLFMEPLGCSVLMRTTMINVLKELKIHKDSILNALDIFVKEPLAGWSEKAAEQICFPESADQDDVANESILTPEWYPLRKLDIARRKLNGENPSKLLIEELKSAHSKKEWLGKIVEAVVGVEELNIRATVGDIISLADQVDSLIDLATDKSILGRAWIGWSPWM